jgi:hypothetical protein
MPVLSSNQLPPRDAQSERDANETASTSPTPALFRAQACFVWFKETFELKVLSHVLLICQHQNQPMGGGYEWAS